MALPRRNAVARVALVALAVSAGVLAGGCSLGSGATSNSVTTRPDPAALLVPLERRAVAAAKRAVAVSLPTKPGAVAPTLPATAFATPLPAHQVVGFLPYWEVGYYSPDYASLTTLAYFAVTVGRGGTISRSGAGWAAFQSSSLAGDIRAAHAAGDRVLLTIFSESTPVLHSLAVAPTTTGVRLAGQVASLLRSGGLDGVDVDLEGSSAPDRDGFARFMAAFSSSLKAADSRWSVILNTYPSSAFDPAGFFDIKALLPHVDQFFVMAYDMQNPQVPSPTAPLFNASLNDAMTLAEYTSVVPASRVVLGIPLYGYDFTASRGGSPAAVTGTPVAVTYGDIVDTAHTAMWDPVTDTAWTSFRRSGKWHQTWFDDPVSIALKTSLAAQFGCAGVGVWELAMSGGDPGINAALLGGRPPVKLPLASTG